MIALPIFLQMVLEYNALEAGLSLAPLSLSMFAVAMLAGRRAGRPAPEPIIRAGFALLLVGVAALDPVVPRADSGLVAGAPAHGRGLRPRPARLAAEQLHPVADRRGAHQRGGRA